MALDDEMHLSSLASQLETVSIPLTGIPALHSACVSKVAENIAERKTAVFIMILAGDSVPVDGDYPMLREGIVIHLR